MNWSGLRIAVLGLVLPWGGNLHGLDPRKPVTQYSLTVWRTGDGLPDIFAQAVLPSRDGYLWIGTAEGAVRFDGFRFTVFDTQNTPALKHNSVVSLCETRDGALWVGTSGGGVAIFEKGRFSATLTTANGLPNNYVRSIYEDRQGNVWITAHDGGLARYQGGRLTVLTKQHGLPSNSLRTVFEDRQGTLWVGTDEDGVCTYKGGRFSCFGRAQGLRSNQIRAFYEDRQGRLWVGTRAGGLHYFDGGRFHAFAGPEGLRNSAIRAIVQDRDGNLWIGAEGGGVYRMNASGAQSLSTRDGLPHSFVRSLAEDKEGNVWLGTRGGLARLRDKKAVTWTTAEGLANDNARALFEDAQGRVWIGTTAGVSLLERESFRTVHLSSEWSRDVVRSIAQTSDGAVWIGADTGLFRWKDGVSERAASLPLAPRENIRALLTDRRGRIWIGAQSGLVVTGSGSATWFSRADGIPAEGVNAIAEDRAGNLWLGTEEGVIQWREGVVAQHTSRDGLAHDRVTSIHVDAADTVWIGTRGGLSRLRNGRFATFRRRDGLLSDNLLGVSEDRLGHLWLTSRRGISRISKQDLEQFAQGQSNELRPVSFDTADGMKSRECNGEAQPAALRTRDGRMWFPTVQGVVVFDPQRLKVNPVPPRVVVERLVSGSRAWPPADGSVSLAAGSGDLEFQFTAISLSAPERVRFKYRLDGYDANWVETSRRRSAWYTNLPPGQYRFRVVAYAHDGSWPREEASLEVNLEPRFHQTLWFYALCGAATAALVILGYRLRVVTIHRRYAAVLEERARIGREIHDTLMQGVTGISLQLEVASQRLPAAPSEAKRQLERALLKLDEVVADARRTVLELRSPLEPDGDLERPLRKLAEDLASEGGVGLEVTVEGTVRPLPKPVCTHLLRIAGEAVTNSLLHAKASQVRIHLRFQPGEVRLEAIDDGCGFQLRERHAGHFGIQGMFERAEALGGTLRIASKPGQGTEVSVVVPAGG